MDIYIATRSTLDQSGRQRQFQYYLTVDTVAAGPLCCENYGVRITEEGNFSAVLPSLTPSATRIDQLMTTLVDNVVGPVGLQDVVDDWL